MLLKKTDKCVISVRKVPFVRLWCFMVGCFMGLSLFLVPVMADDGSRLWLSFHDDTCSELPSFSSVTARKGTLVVKELQEAWTEIAGASLPQTKKIEPDGLVLGTASDPFIRQLHIDKDLRSLGRDGYLIRTFQQGKKRFTVVASSDDRGLLYGLFHFLRLIQTGDWQEPVSIAEKPAYKLRMLNHWDNLDGTVERGYAGHSIWEWRLLPDSVSSRYRQYARANASIGINGTVLNNVNADPEILSSPYLQKVKVIADQLRPYHIQVFLSVNFASPAELGNLDSADPLDPAVARWWKQKVEEIYRLIPDFGGFLIKANSEGLPGPQDYGRSHAEGANMLAEALDPYGGIVIWRAFVYNPDGEDRAKQAYNEFMPLDGLFRGNVLIQVKNGPVDFQPREPFNPLFGAMKKTPLMPELQITQEYLGFSNHLVFLATQWKEFLDSDTYGNGRGSTVVKMTDGSLRDFPLTAIAGVANIGKEANWCGHHFAQANWYAFGRLAWNPLLSARTIADEWVRMTFTDDEAFVGPVTEMMIRSHETAVDYMMPLGLHHLFAWGHHYGPEPWCDVPGARPDWLPSYYHNADERGIGFDRTSTGSNAVSQYSAPLNLVFDDVSLCPENLLLWFHHVPWNHPMKSGRTLWDELCCHYDCGVKQIREFQKTWNRTQGFIDQERFHHVEVRLRIQARDAVWWRDACLLYFQTFSREPFPDEIECPVHDLEELKKIKLDLKHHN